MYNAIDANYKFLIHRLSFYVPVIYQSDLYSINQEQSRII